MRLGEYTLEAVLGRGGMGTVHRARSARGEAVAIKVLAKSDPETLRRFERERRLLGSFTAREGFVPLLEAGVAPAGPYLVMPLVPGGTLRARLAKGPLSIDDVLALGRSLAAAIAVAHERGIVHRDLKPENVLLTANGTPLIADLGLAKHFGSDAPGASQSLSLSRHGALRGTAGYMAPEQAADAKSVGPPADVFALGAILYECVAGRPAFEADSFIALLERVASGAVEPLRRARPECPEWLARAIEEALDRKPERRPADGRALAAPAARRPAARLGLMAAVAVIGLTASALALATRGPSRRECANALERAAVARAAVGDERLPIALYTWVLELYPDEVGALVNRSMSRLRTFDFAGASADANRALELDPRPAMAWANRGTARVYLGDVPRGIADLTMAIAIDPGASPGWLGRGMARLACGDHEGALADLSVAIERGSAEPAVFGMRAEARAKLGDHAGAIADYDVAIARAPRAARFPRDRGVARVRAGDFEGALADFDRAIELDPRDTLTWLNRGNVHADAGDLAAAIADYTTAIQLAPGDPDAWNNRCVANARRKNLAATIADAEQFMALAPPDGVTPAFRAELEAVRQRAARARELVATGRAKTQARDFAGAVADFSAAIELDAFLVDAWNGRADARSYVPDLDGEIADLDRVIELAPAMPGAFANRGLARQSKRDFAGAIEDCTRALELNPDTRLASTAHATRGSAKYQSGDDAGALVDLERAVELDPQGQQASTLRGMIERIRARR